MAATEWRGHDNHASLSAHICSRKRMARGAGWMRCRGARDEKDNMEFETDTMTRPGHHAPDSLPVCSQGPSVPAQATVKYGLS